MIFSTTDSSEIDLSIFILSFSAYMLRMVTYIKKSALLRVVCLYMTCYEALFGRLL